MKPIFTLLLLCWAVSAFGQVASTKMLRDTNTVLRAEIATKAGTNAPRVFYGGASGFYLHSDAPNTVSFFSIPNDTNALTLNDGSLDYYGDVVTLHGTALYAANLASNDAPVNTLGQLANGKVVKIPNGAAGTDATRVLTNSGVAWNLTNFGRITFPTNLTSGAGISLVPLTGGILRFTNESGAAAGIQVSNVAASGTVTASGEITSSAGLKVSADTAVGRTGGNADTFYSSSSGFLHRSASSGFFAIDVDNNSTAEYFAWQANAATFSPSLELMRLTELGSLSLGTNSAPHTKFGIRGGTNEFLFYLWKPDGSFAGSVDTNGNASFNNLSISGSGGYMAINTGTNAINAAPTNYVINPLLGARQWVFPTNNINIVHITNQPTTVATNIPFTLLVNTIGLGSNVRLSWPTGFRRIGPATTNDTILVSNCIHHIDFETYGPGETYTSIAVGHCQ